MQANTVTKMRKNDWRSRNSPGYIAFVVHRLSGLALALFLPLHFLALGTSLQGAAALDRFLAWSDMPLFRIGAWGLVVLLAAHLAGGMRLLIIEFGAWHGPRNAWIGAALAASIGVAIALGVIMFG
jgi:fumarate reductase subunit D